MYCLTCYLLSNQTYQVLAYMVCLSLTSFPLSAFHSIRFPRCHFICAILLSVRDFLSQIDSENDLSRKRKGEKGLSERLV